MLPSIFNAALLTECMSHSITRRLLGLLLLTFETKTVKSSEVLSCFGPSLEGLL